MKGTDISQKNISRKKNISRNLFLTIIIISIIGASSEITMAIEPVVIRVTSANPSTQTYTFACIDNGTGLSGNGVRNWFLYPEDTGVDELITSLPANQTLTHTFSRAAYYDITCEVPNPPGLNYTSLYRHSLHIDLRTNLGNPAVIPLSVAPNQVTEKCVYNGTNYTTSWFLSTYSFTGGSGNTVRYFLNDTNSVLTFMPPFTPGLFDTHCLITTANGTSIDTPMGIDFPNSGSSATPYIADQYGINLAGIYAPFDYNTWISLHNGAAIIPTNTTTNSTGNQTTNQTGNTTGNNTGNQTGNNTGNQTSNQTTISYTSVYAIPANCTGGTITSDTSANGRAIACSNGNNSLSIIAWNKPSDTSPQYFEMYKQSSTGSGVQICLASTCISNNGYAKSPNFPITVNATIPQANTTTNQTGNLTGNSSGNQTGGSNNSIFYTSVYNIPSNCTGGTITSDTSTNGRAIMCANGTNSLSITAWNKPSDNAPQFFEMYKQTLNGTGITICLLNTCISNNGFAQSPNFPIIGSGNTTNNSTNNTTNTTSPKSLSLMIAPGFPDGLSYGFICSPTNFTPSGYDWAFGDGQGFSNVTNTVYHAYASSGSYTVQCTATGTNITTSMNIVANVPTTSPGMYVTDFNNQPPLPPTWLEPPATGVYPNDFHLHTNNAVFQGPDAANDSITYSDFEIWDVPANQLIWASYKESVDPYHIHRYDGTFMGNLAGQNVLLWNHTYEVRARFYEFAQFNNVSNWSSWRVFQTIPPINITPTATSWTPAPGYEILKVASNISLPVNVEMAPNLYSNLPQGQQPILYVTQLYGQIGVLLNNGTYQQYAGNLLSTPPPGGIPGGGEAGVDGLYVDQTTGDLYASMSYLDNTSITGMSAKVVHFKTNANGNGFTTSNIIIDKIPVRPSHEAHTILKGPDGKMYLSVGDADQLSWPQDPTKFNGKVLRLNWDGSMPSDNPFPGTYTYALGFRNPFGMAFRPGTNELYVSNNGQDTDDGLYKTSAGSQFGWPNSLTQGVWVGWPVEIAPTQVAFDPYDAFPNDTNNVYVVGSGSTYLQGPSPNSKRIFQIPINPDGTHGNQTPIVTYTGAGFGDPIGVAFAPDGAYFTDIYGDLGFTGAGVTQGNIYKVIWTGQNSTTNQTTNQTGNQTGPVVFSTVIAQHPWYPQGLNMIWDCKSAGGSGNFTYDFVFGDGNQLLNLPQNNAYVTYPAHGTYNTSCTVHDITTGQQASASTTLSI